MAEVLISGRRCRLFGAEKPACFLIQPSARHETPTLEEEVGQLTALTAVPFLLVTIDLEDWIVDLMPWADRNISREEEAGKHGQETLEYILKSLIPWLEDRYGSLPAVIGGYSLGALFALWASARTDRFQAVAAASPSVWIKDWVSYARKNSPRAEAVYLSLGEREEHVKNQAIARVGDCLRAQYELLREQLGEERCTLVWEEGNHFADNAGRLARAFAWCLRRGTW